MKLFKYLFFLIVLVFVLGSLYVATISIPEEKQVSFKSTISKELFKNKIQDLSTYNEWFKFPEEDATEQRLSNAGSFENTNLAWQNDKFETINIQNQKLTTDSITQQLRLKTWLSSSEFNVSWNFKPADTSSSLLVRLTSDASFWQKTEYVITGKSHIELTEAAVTESLNRLEQSIKKEIEVYDIKPIGEVETESFHLLHATSASRLKYESILNKSNPIFESIEEFMSEQQFNSYNGRIILFENLYDGEDNIIFSSGVGVKNLIAIPDNYDILSKAVEGNIYFKTQLIGDYTHLEELFSKSEAALGTRGLSINTELKPYLEFEVDPNKSINPAEWTTNLYVPIKEN